MKNYICEKIAEIGACNGNIPIYSLEYKGEMELAGVQATCNFYGLQLYDFMR